MTNTIYQKEPGALIPQGDKSYSTFDSGLCRVAQTFICPTSNVQIHRQNMEIGADFPGDQSPAIDGLFIFPSPQEITRPDGLTEIHVTAYGRATATPIDERRIGFIEAMAIDNTPELQGSELALFGRYWLRRTVRRFDDYTAFDFSDLIGQQVYYDTDGSIYDVTQLYDETWTLSYHIVASTAPRVTSYGVWDEYEHVVKISPRWNRS